MKILFIIHASFEQPGSIAAWAEKHGHQIKKISPFLGEKLPSVDDFDFLVVMGGPQSPLGLDEAPYLLDEIELIKKAINKQKHILGICLGAQLIGEALGAKTERSPHREIGVFPLELLSEAQSDPIFRSFPAKFDVMHWHSDMPGLSDGAALLAKSEGCPRQVIRYSEKIYGFQCHFELTLELVKGMIENCPDNLKTGTYIRSQKQLLNANYSEINLKLDQFLDYLVTI